MSPRLTFSRSRRGSVIVVVLVTLLLASLMIVKFMESSAVELTLATRRADRERLREDAYGALETLLAVMAEIKEADDDQLNDPAQGWNDPYGYAGESPREGVTVAYVFQDESGKASLPRMSFEEMVELAQALGLGDTDAKRFADGLFAWIKENHLPQDIEAEASRYERDDPPITVPKRSLRSWEELRAVRVARDYVYDEEGALTPFGAALRENVSLYDFEGTNVNSLAPALGTARGWDSTQAQQLAGFRAGKSGRKPGAPPWFRSIEDVTTVVGANVDVKGLDAAIKLMRVTVTVREGAASMSLDALIGLADGVALPASAKPDGEAASGGANALAGQNGNTGAQATGEPAPATGRAGRRGAGANDAGTAGGAGNASGTEEKLDYPFGILEVVETAGPPPVVSPEEEPTSL
jgi:general secretion pathway protein K